MKIEEKILFLKSKLETLHDEYIETKSEYASTKDSLRHVFETLNKDENFELKMKLIKEVLAKELEFMRIRISIIKTIAPKTASRLEKEMNSFEKKNRSILNSIEKIRKKTKGEGITQVLTNSFSFKDDSSSVIIDLCLSSIKETLTKLEKNSKNS